VSEVTTRKSTKVDTRHVSRRAKSDTICQYSVHSEHSEYLVAIFGKRDLVNSDVLGLNDSESAQHVRFRPYEQLPSRVSRTKRKYIVANI